MTREVKPTVEAFAKAMESKLMLPKNAEKSHWREEGFRDLFFKLDREVDELRAALFSGYGTAEGTLSECCDVANFAMFIADKIGGLEVAKRPKVVCLCGSTRFLDAFRKANYDETTAGNIVLTIGCDIRTDDDLFGHLEPMERSIIKNQLDALHLKKIEMADEVLILNVAGYIGESTGRELTHALELGKPVRYLEPIVAEAKK